MSVGPTAVLHSRTVLVVDDNASNLRLAVDYLEQGGMNVAIARDGREALERAVYLKPDLILLDALMPGMNGFVTCQHLKANHATRDIPVIFMTALADMKDKISAFAAGAVDYVSKPFQPEELLARVRTHLALGAAQRQSLELNEQLRTTLGSIGQGVCLFNAAGRLILANSRYAEVYGLDPASIRPGMTIEAVLRLRYAVGSHTDMSLQEYLAWADKQNANDAPSVWVLELKSGRVIRGYHQRTSDGGWVSTHEDITHAWRIEKDLAQAREQAECAEHEARAAHARLLDAFEVVPEGVALFDSEDRYVLWNRRYEELYADSSDKIVKGMRFEDTLCAGLERAQYPEAIGREKEWLAERLARHAEAKSTHEQHLTGNRWLRIEERRTADGGSVGIRIDITDLKQREASFRLLFDNNPVPMWVYDRATLKFLAVNQATIDHYGYSRERFLSMTLLDIRPEEDWETVKAATTKTHAEDGGCSWRHHKADGSEIEVLIYSRRLVYQHHDAALIAIIDITERKRAEHDLQTTREFLDTVIESVPVMISVKDAAEERYVLVNKAGEELLGLPRSELIGKTVYEVLPRAAADNFTMHDQELLRCGGSQMILGDVLETLSKGRRTVNSSAVTIAGKDGSPRYLLHVIEDVTERVQAERRAAHLALHDALTGLPNRVALKDKLASLLDANRAQVSPFAVLCLGLDHFKEVNDVFGHNVGDTFLCTVARRLEHAAEDAFLARLGGDEFMLVMEGHEQPAAAAGLADRVLAAFNEEVDIDLHRIKAGVSIGVTVFPSDGTDATRLMANADAALCRAKADCRGTVRFFEPTMDQHLREKRALQRDLHAALAEGQLSVHYQPQALIGGDIVGFEALSRWRHPTRGDVPPSDFIPVAEESSLICDIGAWVLRAACREAASWRRDLQIGVNLSAIQFKHDDLPRLIDTILLETGLAPQRLELEITESVLIGDFSRTLSILRSLKSLGVRIVMDDFGTGYSSLSYLQSFPFDKIKIDRSFVADVAHPQSAAIIRAVIGLGRSLHLPVVAEGVETSSQLTFLANESCDQVQGYLIGKPRPIQEYALHTSRGGMQTWRSHSA